MKLLYTTSTGEIMASVYNIDWFKFTHSINIPISEFEIDEVFPDNKDICFGLYKYTGRVNSEGLGKYYIENGELFERDGWEEAIIDV